MIGPSATTLCAAYLSIDRPRRQLLREVLLDVLKTGPAELVLPEATVRDERGGEPLAGGLLADPCRGGGPTADPWQDLQARAFGLVNTAFHVQRAMRTAAALLDRPLPHLLVRIGMHEGSRRWGGGHYRVAARNYDPAEPGPVSPLGEVHLGGGAGFLPTPGGEPYFAAPAHNVAIVCHEVGHHLCRHTADFRLNALRRPYRQTNKKVAVDEGTCDVFTAILLGTPDIYGWHRGDVPEWDQRRRRLDPRWGMARFRGGRADPHSDGTIWASACWSAREQVAEAGHPPARFDRMLLCGLDLSAGQPAGEPTEDARRRRRHYAGLLEAMLRVDPALADPVLAGMARHGIRPGRTNSELREVARARPSLAVGG
jgi:hypothetical protein